MLTGGQLFDWGKCNVYVDVLYNRAALDGMGTLRRMGVDEAGNPLNRAVQNVEYLTCISELNYRFHSKWNAFVKGMYETASVTKASEGIEKGNYSTSWGYLAGIEFYPMETNLHFFVTYVGRSYDFTSRAKVLGQENYSTNRVSVGFIWQMPVF